MNIRTRIAPSPTGFFHIGTARAALFNYLYAKKNKGEFILRIEDTDKERSKKEYEDDIKTYLSWLGLEWDEDYRQSERNNIYQKYAKKLLERNLAYKEEGRDGKGEAVVLTDQKKSIEFRDVIRGPISFGAEFIEKIVLLKSDGSPAYNFAAAIDDVDMNITHVIRGEDHISNTPKQILIQEALGLKRPQYAHIPLVLGPDRSKLSKRHGAEKMGEYRRSGYLAPALVNFMAMLGWNPDSEQELFSLPELKDAFDLEEVQKSGAIFNRDKLDWFNHQYIQKIKDEDFKKILQNYIEEFKPGVKKEFISDTFLDVIRSRIKKLSDVQEDLDWFKKPIYNPRALNWKKTEDATTKQNLEEVLNIIGDVKEKDFGASALESKLMPLANDKGRGEVLWPLRFSLSGKERSPSPFELMAMLGREETIERIKTAISKI